MPTFSSGSVIKLDTYNDAQQRAELYLGTGSGFYGLGGTVTSQALPAGSVIKVSDYDKLKADIIKGWRHKFGQDPTPADLALVVNSVIVPGKAQNYYTYADFFITDNPYNVYTGSTTGSYTQQVSVTQSSVSTLASFWNNGGTPGATEYAYLQFDCTWPTITEARNFFNSGGYLKFILSRDNNIVNAKSAALAQVVDAMIAENYTYNGTDYYNSSVSAPLNKSKQFNATQAGFTNFYGILQFSYRDSGRTIRMYIEINDTYAFASDFQLGSPMDFPITVTMAGGMEYRKSVDAVVATTPTFTIPSWVVVPG